MESIAYEGRPLSVFVDGFVSHFALLQLYSHPQILGVSRAYFRFSRAYGSKLISCVFFLACFSNLVHFNNTLTHVTGLIKYRKRLKLSSFAGMAEKSHSSKCR